MKYDIWEEGCAFNEGAYPAIQLASNIEANSFKEACIKWYNSLSEEEKINHGSYNKEDNTIFGCRLFDNELDARKSFG